MREEGGQVLQEKGEGCCREFGSQDNQKGHNEMEAVSDISSRSQTLHLLQFLKEYFINVILLVSWCQLTSQSQYDNKYVAANC